MSIAVRRRPVGDRLPEGGWFVPSRRHQVRRLAGELWAFVGSREAIAAFPFAVSSPTSLGVACRGFSNGMWWEGGYVPVGLPRHA